MDNTRRGGDGQHEASGATDNTMRGGGRGTTQDKQVADNVRQVMQGNPAVDNTRRRRGWRTWDNAEGGGNSDDEDEEEQSLWWQGRCYNGNTYQSFVYNATTN